MNETIRVKIDAQVADEFEELMDELGLNAEIAINIFVKACLRERKIPFEICEKKLEVCEKPKTPFEVSKSPPKSSINLKEMLSEGQVDFNEVFS